ncbi:general negative regulator of transcription subunit 5 [Entomortierella beljakovae]|nr:general negative regulator of transcription subunit 5 [Entomortierella beljakovae]
MATRKLQTEIDKVLKKVSEGVETFEEILEKIETSTNANQKEKYESDLKKEIKKLQRLRDQIKTWISSNDIKDKRALMDNRKLIEQQMEKFKAIEKEMKTKAYSREGLIMSGRLDPKEKEKAETCSWLTERVEALSIQIEGMEAEVETLQASTKKGKNNPAKERVGELEEKIERHKWHQGRLELILRLLENGQIDTDKVLAVQEDVNYYVDENTDPDFAEDEEIYTDLNLSDEEDFFAVGMEDHTHDSEERYKEEQEVSSSPAPKKLVKEPEPEPLTPKVTTPVVTVPVPVPAQAQTQAPAKSIPTKKLSVTEVKETKPAPVATPVAPKPTPAAAAPPSRQPTLPRAVPVESPVIQYATAAAANLPAETLRAQPSSSPNVAAAALKESPKLGDVSTKVESPSSKAVTPVVVAPSTFASQAPLPSQSPSLDQFQSSFNSQPLVSTETKATSSSDASISEQSHTPLLQTSLQQDTQSLKSQPNAPPGMLSTPAEPEIRLPAALADLAHSFEASKERALMKEVGFFAQQMLEASYQFIPEAADTERPKYYQPKNPYPTPAYYPQSPPPGLFESPAMFEKFDIDTLFFIFYYQQGTYQQYLAARELKKQSWRFHKKYLTWFQRHEEPKAITDDYEQGTYIYFDYEGAWCQRKKTDFRFEYKFLEDSELV